MPVSTESRKVRGDWYGCKLKLRNPDFGATLPLDSVSVVEERLGEWLGVIDLFSMASF